MFKGGYQIVDFTGITLSGTATTISGLYNTLTKCDKPILIRGLTANSLDFTPFMCNGASVSTNFVILGPVILDDGSGAIQIIITVSNADAVTLAIAEITSAASE